MLGRHPRTIVITLRCFFAVLVVSLASAKVAAGQSALRAITVSTVGSEAVVTVEASGPLPTPTLGALDGPPRVFLDFANVRLAARPVPHTADPRVRRVRVGTYSLNPLVTRVVIDLTSVLPHRIELATGRVLVFIGTSTPAAPAVSAVPPAPMPGTSEPGSGARPSGVAMPDASSAIKPATPTSNAATRSSSAPARSDAPPSATLPPVPALPPPPPEGARAPRSAPRVPPSSSTTDSSGGRLPYRSPTPPPAKDLEKYRGQVGTLLERLKLQMPLLGVMQTIDEDLDSRMPAALQEFDRLRTELEAIKPPDTVRTQHDLLVQAARLASRAAMVRLEAVRNGSPDLRRNAASAAAGASMMLERAFAEVGFGQDGR